MNLRDIPHESKELPIGLLDPPNIDARIDRDEEQLDELARDIATRGVIHELIVLRRGERFEIVDGFCRYLASRRAQRVTVPCLVYAEWCPELESAKYAANAFRLEMSPADEANYFVRLFNTVCREDIDAVCALVNKRRGYVDSRLQLALGDAEILQAVKDKKLSLGVAEELNKIPAEDYRRYYLKLAVRDGITRAVAIQWVTFYNTTYGVRPPAAAPESSPASAVVVAAHDPHRCYVCRKSDPRFIPETLLVHTHCRLANLDPMLDAFHGGGAGS